MKQYSMVITGGIPLKGTVTTQGAKNAALTLMPIALLLKGKKWKLSNIPNLSDTQTMTDLLTSLGVKITQDENGMTFDVPEEISYEVSEQKARKMRASSLVLGPLMARCKRAVLPLPGGCSIGSRPIDLHLKGLVQMGAETEIINGAVHASAKRLRGCRIYLDFPSVGATENLLMAAVFAEGTTTIENTAREPEIFNLIDALKDMGVPIEADGTGLIKVTGVEELDNAEAKVIPDRIEACTYILSSVITGSEVTVKDIILPHVDALLAKLEEAGCGFTVKNNSVTVHPMEKIKGYLPLRPVSIKTLPFPGFPTDAQPQTMAVLALANGVSTIHENLFETRFMHAAELNKMGANIEVSGSLTIIRGVKELQGARVTATDLRAGAALILAGLAAQGETVVEGFEHVTRGYESIDKKLSSLGAKVHIEENEIE
ncbi:MAG: UDP-N-acetylglucosamine 1-carboxyvinyltransferase [Synergistaceae bacterium]|nr:UDP-N-acetylglucosamine 1-carboxyvinyltransferase [Synergistaceae bacterium]